jgi:hypothetical protein
VVVVAFAVHGEAVKSGAGPSIKAVNIRISLFDCLEKPVGFFGQVVRLRERGGFSVWTGLCPRSSMSWSLPGFS